MDITFLQNDKVIAAAKALYVARVDVCALDQAVTWEELTPAYKHLLVGRALDAVFDYPKRPTMVSR